MSLPTSTQIKITLPLQLQRFVQGKADKFGLSMSAYLKHLILNDIQQEDLPTFTLSTKNEKVALVALKAHKQKKTHQIGNIDTFITLL